jgi:hypothetical protein
LTNTRLQQLPYSNVLLHDLAADRRFHRSFERRRRGQQGIGIVNTQNLQRGFCRGQVALRLHLGRLSLLQVLFSEGVMLIEVLGSCVGLLRE